MNRAAAERTAQLGDKPMKTLALIAVVAVGMITAANVARAGSVSIAGVVVVSG